MAHLMAKLFRTTLCVDLAMHAIPASAYLYDLAAYLLICVTFDPCCQYAFDHINRLCACSFNQGTHRVASHTIL